jgi:hypothetical protein
MVSKDLNYIAALEKAISEQYGPQAAMNPKAGWDAEKEKEYLQLSKEKMIRDSRNDSSSETIQLDGILIPKKLFSSVQKRKCEHCQTYSFNREDDVYFSKYETCRQCYIKYIEDREDRWKSGWRPNKLE